MRTQAARAGVVLSVIVPWLLAPMVQADVVSPGIKDKGQRYTSEKPLASYYGSGSSGRLVEASELRMTVEDLIAAGEWEAAIPKAKKAVQLDPGDPSGHLFLAKVLTMKLYDTKGKVEEKLLSECIREWQLIRYHDADPTEQWEAGQQVKKLLKIAKALEKEKLLREKEYATSGPANGGQLAGKPGASDGSNASASTKPGDESAPRQVAAKKRFGLF